LFLKAPDSGAPSAALGTLAPLLAKLEPSWIVGHTAAGPWRFIVLDCFQTPEGEYRRWASLAFLIGIDEGGPCRDRFDFLIDLLPGLPGRCAPNILDPGLLPLPRRTHAQLPPESGPLKILISFGAEDNAGLGPLAAIALKDQAPQDIAITLINPQEARPGAGQVFRIPGALCRNGGGFTVLRNIPGLGEHLANYDLLITHFGLTAFEALRAGTPVLLVSPGPYHEKLARAAGFLSAGIGKRGIRRLKALLIGRGPRRDVSRRRLGALGRRCDSLARRYGIAGRGPDRPGLADFLAAAEPKNSNRRCPGCGGGDTPGAGHPVLARFADRLFRRCKDCGLVYMARINEPPIEYGEAYFFELDRKQYGKTYLEDFPHLVDMGRRRLSLIRSLLPAEGGDGSRPAAPPRLLDIGCAYGPFLQAAAQEGFDVRGLDPAEDAVRYVRDTLKLPASRGLFPLPAGSGQEGEFRRASFSVITLWYVIEHINHLAEALQEAGRLLEEGGVLAFSTPSFSGISGRASLKGFLEKSPADHWSVWNPRVARKLLKRHGFSLKKVVSTGHHPERFPLLGKLCRPERGPWYRCLLLFSRVFGWGDTFEAYAVKESPVPGGL
jgi:2-polyprenyl-3-methyl-5-hydroxy-6-metoxy-1,4-benzoquinol methylase